MPLPTLLQVTHRMHDCVTDVRSEGTNLVALDDVSLEAFIRRYDGYFHMMLGIDLSNSEIFDLIRHDQPEGADRAETYASRYGAVEALSG